MTPRQFADLAAVVSRHAESIAAATGAEPSALHRVWKRSSACFKARREELVSAATPRTYAELFAAELPLRVWCTAIGRSGTVTAGSAVAGKIFADLLEARCMALQALAVDHGLTASEAAAVDRFRRRCERWIDVLVGPVASRTGVTDFAVRPDRAVDFGSNGDPADGSPWPLLVAGLRLAFASADDFRGASTGRSRETSVRLSAAIVATLPAVSFDPTGALRSPAVARVARVVDERRPAKTRRRSPAAGAHPSPPVAESPPAAPVPRHGGPISFASLRKPRPAGS